MEKKVEREGEKKDPCPIEDCSYQDGCRLKNDEFHRFCMIYKEKMSHGDN